jgi:hypothetical protein
MHRPIPRADNFLMQPLSHQHAARLKLRERICTQCDERPAGSDTLPLTASRICETVCPIFINLPQLLRISEDFESPYLATYDRAINDCICGECARNPMPNCGRGDCSCALERHLDKVIKALSELRA